MSSTDYNTFEFKDSDESGVKYIVHNQEEDRDDYIISGPILSLHKTVYELMRSEEPYAVFARLTYCNGSCAVWLDPGDGTSNPPSFQWIRGQNE